MTGPLGDSARPPHQPRGAAVASNPRGGEPGSRGRHRHRRGPGAASPGDRSGSPLISPGLQPAALTVALAGLIALTAPLGQLALLPAVALLQAVTAAGWFRLNGMWPARQGIALAFAGGLAADAAVLIAPRERASDALLGVLGAWFLMVLVLQLRHRGSAEERLDSLTATAASSLLTVLATGLLAAGAVSSTSVVIAAAAVAAAVAVRAVLTVAWLSPVLALAAATGAGAGAGQATGFGVWSVALGASAGLCALAGLRVASYDFPSRFVHFTAGVALPLAIASPVVYVMARVAL